MKTMFRPCAIRSDAKQWRRSWKRSRGSPSRSRPAFSYRDAEAAACQVSEMDRMAACLSQRRDRPRRCAQRGFVCSRSSAASDGISTTLRNACGVLGGCGWPFRSSWRRTCTTPLRSRCRPSRPRSSPCLSPVKSAVASTGRSAGWCSAQECIDLVGSQEPHLTSTTRGRSLRSSCASDCPGSTPPRRVGEHPSERDEDATDSPAGEPCAWSSGMKPRSRLRRSSLIRRSPILGKRWRLSAVW